MNVTLTRFEIERLLACEKIVEDGLPTVFAMAEALQEIRDRQLYRAAYMNWEEYCESRWGFSRQYAGYLIRGFKTMKSLMETSGFPPEVLPTTERTIRSLSKVPERKRSEVYEKAVELAGGKRPTQRHVEDAVVISETAHKKPSRPVDAPRPPARETKREPMASQFDEAITDLDEFLSFINTIKDLSNNNKYIKAVRAREVLKFYSPTYALFDLPLWVPRDKWDKFVIMRGKREITAHAFQLLMGKLEELRADGHDPGDIIDLAIERKWLSFFPPSKQHAKNGNAPFFGEQSPENDERILRAALPS